MNIFEQASKLNLTFQCDFVNGGVVSTNDLWTFNESQLNKLYIFHKGKERQLNVDSLIGTNNDPVLALRLEIIQHIFSAKKVEAEMRNNKAAIKAKKQRLTELLAEKQDIKMKELSAEELQKMIKELE